MTGVTGQTTTALQTPTGYSGIYADWNVDLDGDTRTDDPWDFGTASQYPALSVDFDGDGYGNLAGVRPATPRRPDPDPRHLDGGPGRPELDGGHERLRVRRP